MMDMGGAVVMDTGTVEIVLISRHVEPSDLNCLSSIGIDPMQKRYMMLKSRIHWRAGLGKMAKAVVDCAGGRGVHFRLWAAQIRKGQATDLSARSAQSLDIPGVVSTVCGDVTPIDT
jgi:microcystin degradation protein MlrC